MVRRLAKGRREEPLPAVPWQECWGKTSADGSPGVGVYEHCLVVGRVAEALLPYLPPGLRDRLPTGLPALAALHDVGKVMPGFQLQCPAWREAMLKRFRTFCPIRLSALD
jgi:hypothetical protein